MPYQHCERLCAAERLKPEGSSSLIYHFWFLKHHHSAATPHHHCRLETQLSYPWKLHACKANNNYFLSICFYFLLSVFIVFNSIIQNKSYCSTVYTDYIYLYNYLWQMHQIIIHLSPVGCFLPQSKVKRAKKSRSGVNSGLFFFFLAELPRPVWKTGIRITLRGTTIYADYI